MKLDANKENGEVGEENKPFTELIWFSGYFEK
jgi:hypothetical protein